MMDRLITGAEVLNPRTGERHRADVLIEDGRISRVAPSISVVEEGRVEHLTAEGLTIIPGLIDMHVHFRDPGFEYKEDLESGLNSAARGGFTRVACMPNTKPVLDNAGLVSDVKKRADKKGQSELDVIGAITKGSQGKEITEIGDMLKEGIVGISDDGKPVCSSEIMRCALEYAKMFDLPVIAHEEDPELMVDGVMHRGRISTMLGMPSIPREAEEVMVARDILLARLTGGHLHIAHVSSAGTVEMIRRAKSQGINVTAEVTPHHLTLNDEWVKKSGFDPNLKINPPLRTEKDRRALVEALSDGTIDMVATDHAPHDYDSKDGPFDQVAFGAHGLETAFPVLYTQLVESGELSLATLVERMTLGPASVFGLEGIGIEEGLDADLTLIDEKASHVIDSRKFASKGKNTPFEGWECQGKPVMTLKRGKIIHEEM